jgi:hypothetical protein
MNWEQCYCSYSVVLLVKKHISYFYILYFYIFGIRCIYFCFYYCCAYFCMWNVDVHIRLVAFKFLGKIKFICLFYLINFIIIYLFIYLFIYIFYLLIKKMHFLNLFVVILVTTMIFQLIIGI